MPFSPTRWTRLRSGALLAALAVGAFAGCGASASAVKSRTTVTALERVAPSTTESIPATTAPTPTTEATTTTGRTVPTTGGTWPKEAREVFLEQCEGGDTGRAPVCECSLRALEPLISVAQLMDIESAGDLPPDVEDMITKVTRECTVDPDAH